KGVGVFFCTQLPTDIPNPVLSQLGARIQHALRAFTPDDQKALAKTVRTYPRTAHYDLEKALTSLGTGEAMVTVLSERGAPTPVAWTRIVPPRSLMDTIGESAISSRALAGGLSAKYRQTIDRESASEILAAKMAAVAPEKPQAPATPGVSPSAGREETAADRIMRNPAVKSFLRSAATAAGREITRSLFGTRRRRWAFAARGQLILSGIRTGNRCGKSVSNRADSPRRLAVTSGRRGESTVSEDQRPIRASTAASRFETRSSTMVCISFIVAYLLGPRRTLTTADRYDQIGD